MENNFRFIGLDKAQFEDYFKLSDSELADRNILKTVVEKFPGSPCRVSLADAKVGEEVILLNFEHHSANSPYKASGPIFVRKIAETIKADINEIPIMFNHRLLSIRGYNKDGIMVFAEVTQGEDLKQKLNDILNNQQIDYLHIHNARPGCFNCLVERV